MSKNILHILSDVLTVAVNEIRTAAIEAEEAEAAFLENAPQEATEAPEQEAAPVETMEAESAAAVEVIAAEVENDAEDQTTFPDDFNDRLKKAMEILKGRK